LGIYYVEGKVVVEDVIPGSPAEEQDSKWVMSFLQSTMSLTAPSAITKPTANGRRKDEDVCHEKPAHCCNG
jgi:hypothetical protein